MVKRILPLAIFLMFASVAQAGDTSENFPAIVFPTLPIGHDQSILSGVTKPQVIQVCSESKSREIIERRGCCSWHGGVCGCKGGRVECCDGTLSPSCTCAHDSFGE